MGLGREGGGERRRREGEDREGEMKRSTEGKGKQIGIDLPLHEPGEGNLCYLENLGSKFQRLLCELTTVGYFVSNSASVKYYWQVICCVH